MLPRVTNLSSFDDPRTRAAILAVVAASKVTQLVQDNLQKSAVLTKKDRSPVTIADFAAQAVVARVLQETLGPICMIAEETSDDLKDNPELLSKTVEAARVAWPEVTAESLIEAVNVGSAEPAAEGFWTLDPIDGTKGFVRGQHYAISLAYIVGSKPVLGVLGCPNLDVKGELSLDQMGEGVLAVAIDGLGVKQGALQDNAALEVVPVVERTSNQIRTCESVEAAHANHGAHADILKEAGLIAEAVRLDSQAKYMVVARNQADAYLRLPSQKGYVEKIWDHAAGAIVAEEAGLRVSDFKGQSLDFSHGRRLEKNRGVLVAGPKHHAKLVAAIKTLGLADHAG